LVSSGHQLVGLLSAVELFMIVDSIGVAVAAVNAVGAAVDVVGAAVNALDSCRGGAAAHGPGTADGVAAAVVVG
jgi:hypothetical protein